MHLELVVPGLLAASPLPRLPALELLAARGRAETSEAVSLERWLASAFGLADQPLPAGALTLLADGRDPGDGFWLRADPVHLSVESGRATLLPASDLALISEEAEAIAETLNGHFGNSLIWVALHPQRWCLHATDPLPIETESPAGRATSAADMLPRGEAAGRARALITEVQLLLHEHPVNRERERRGAPTVNSVWLWGAGRQPRETSAPWQSAHSSHPLVAGLARLARIRHATPPASGVAGWLAHSPDEGRHLFVLDPLLERAGLAEGATGREIEALETNWFRPLLDALRAEHIGMASVHVPDAGRRWETTRGDLRRFWRRAKPLGGPA